MKIKKICILACFFAMHLYSAHAANIMDVYQAALQHDPTYLHALEQYLGDREDVKIRRSVFFPQFFFTGGPIRTCLHNLNKI